jgi:hypothetical protein
MTPTTFLRLLKATQAERDAAPCVVPGGDVMLTRRCQVLVARLEEFEFWEPDGSAPPDCDRGGDIIATLDLHATLERLEELERGL